MESVSATQNVPGTFRQLRRQDDPGPVITSSRTRTPSLPPPRPKTTYDKVFTSLPDEIICEIFSLLDMEALKSCSLTDKTLSCSAKPFIHRTLYLTRRALSQWNEFEELRALGERGLLQHTRHISTDLPQLFAHSLNPYLHTLTNLRTLKTLSLDTPSFIPKTEEYFGAFSGTLRSLELIFPMGDHKQVLHFACRFPNLRDLKVHHGEVDTNSIHNGGGPHPGIRTSPPLDGTLDLNWGVEPEIDPVMAPHVLLDDLVALPSGLRFRTLKLSGWVSSNLQHLVDACASTLECVEFIAGMFGAPEYPQLSFESHPALRKIEVKLVKSYAGEYAVEWLSKALSSITSNVFTGLTIFIPEYYTADEDRVRGWSPFDDVLDRFSPRVGVILVTRPMVWLGCYEFEDSVEKYLPLAWKNGKVVLEPPPA